MENRNCQNCKKDFNIEPDDFSFYEKMKVPAPTFCLECRAIRRMLWRNERSLYHRKCSATDKSIISIYSTDAPFPVYDKDYWWSDAWDPMTYGQDIDFSKSFFEQWNDLMNKVPQASFFGMNLDNCNFCNFFSDSKKCYLCFAGGQNENLLYCGSQVYSKDSIDITLGNKNELCYQDYNCSLSYGLINSSNSSNCIESRFLSNCRGLNYSFGCVNMSQKSYCIWNEQKEKQEYKDIINSLNLGSHKEFEDNNKKFIEHKLKYPVKYANMVNAIDCLGDNIKNSQNSKYCFNVEGLENCKYIIWSAGITKDSYDCMGVGMGSEFVYESVSTVYEQNFMRFVLQCQHGCSNLEYSISCYGSSYLFGCFGLRSKKYCIFNKQYTKEEYEKLVVELRVHMDSMPYIDSRGCVYKYGEFFPTDLSPFSYNETVAQEYFPLDKEEIILKGYKFKDIIKRELSIEIKNSEIPDHINEVDDSIVGKVIECAHKGSCKEQCTEVFTA
jgi:hypothetical protein